MAQIGWLYCAAFVDRAAAWRRNWEKDKTTATKIEHEISSGNVFADIGLPHAGEHLMKAKLVFKFDALMRAQSMKQVEAADLFGVKQPDVSKMLRGNFRLNGFCGFSLRSGRTWRL